MGENLKEAHKYFDLAKQYIEIHWFDEALRAVLESLRMLQFEKNADLNEHYYTLAWIYNQKNDSNNAVIYLNLIEPNSDIYPEAQILKYVIQINKNELSTAKSKLEALLKDNGANQNLISALAKVYFELKMYKKAVKIYEKGLFENNTSYDFLSGMITVLFEEGKIKETEKYLEKFYKLYPNSIDALMFYAKINYVKNETAQALVWLNRLIELDINNAQAHYFKGLILNDLRQTENAIAELKIAIGLSPYNALYYSECSRSFELSGDFLSALLYIKEAVEIAPDVVEYNEKALEFCKKLNDKRGEKFYSNHLKTLGVFQK